MPQSLRVQRLWGSAGWRARASRALAGLAMGAVVLSAAVFTAASPVDLHSVASTVGDVAGRALADVAEQAARPETLLSPGRTLLVPGQSLHSVAHPGTHPTSDTYTLPVDFSSALSDWNTLNIFS